MITRRAVCREFESPSGLHFSGVMKYMNKDEWTEIWANDFLILKLSESIYRLISWKNYKKFLNHLTLSQSSHILELGCGIGKNSLKICKRYGCKATLVDNCKTALNKARKAFNKNNINANFILEDVFALKNRKKYDLVFSDGLAEHFSGFEREKIIKLHANLTKRNGHILLLVPYSSKIYYISRKLFKWFKKFKERPFSSEELLNFCKKNNLKPVKILKPFFGSWIGVLAQRL